MPKQTRKRNEFPSLTNFIFPEGIKVEKEAENTQFKVLPFVTTAADGKMQFSSALIYYEKLTDYVELIDNYILSENTKEFKYNVNVSEQYLEEHKLSEDAINKLRSKNIESFSYVSSILQFKQSFV